MKQLIAVMFFTGITAMANAQVRQGDRAPEISLKNAKDSVVKLSSYKGKVVLVDFWASWCVPCRAANPSVVRLYKKYKAQGFEVFAISIDSKKSDWLKAVKHDGIPYTQVNDPAGWNSKAGENYGIDAIPTSFLLDKSGNIIATDLEGAELENKIKELLN